MDEVYCVKKFWWSYSLFWLELTWLFSAVEHLKLHLADDFLVLATLPPKRHFGGRVKHIYDNIFTRICRMITIQSALGTDDLGKCFPCCFEGISPLENFLDPPECQSFFKKVSFLEISTWVLSFPTLLFRKSTKISFSCDKF